MLLPSPYTMICIYQYWIFNLNCLTGKNTPYLVTSRIFNTPGKNVQISCTLDPLLLAKIWCSSNICKSFLSFILPAAHTLSFDPLEIIRSFPVSSLQAPNLNYIHSGTKCPAKISLGVLFTQKAYSPGSTLC